MKKKKIHQYVKEEVGVLLYLTASILNIVIGGLNFIFSLHLPILPKFKVLCVIWIILGFIGIYLIDYYLSKRDIYSLKLLFYLTLFNFMSASTYFFSALMSFIGLYFIFEDRFLAGKKK